VKARILTYPERTRWNEFAAACPHGSILQSYEWGELKGLFGWQPVRLVLEDNGQIRAGISLLQREIPLIKHSFFYAPRGPLVDLADKELLHELLDAVEEEAERRRVISLKIDPEISEAAALELGVIKNSGFEKARKQVQPRATILLDLRRSEEELLKSFEEKTRYNIRLAAKKGVRIVEEKDPAGVARFYEIYRQTAARDGFLIHPESYYQKIRELIFGAGLGSNFVAYYEGKPVAAVIVFVFGKKLWYMYGASASEYRNVMPNHLLHWEIIKWAQARGVETYDLWGIPANPSEGHPLYGVYRFKKGFAGETVRYIGAYDFPYSPLYYHLLENGLIFWQNLRSLITKGKIEDSLGE